MLLDGINENKKLVLRMAVTRVIVLLVGINENKKLVLRMAVTRVIDKLVVDLCIYFVCIRLFNIIFIILANISYIKLAIFKIKLYFRDSACPSGQLYFSKCMIWY